MRAEEGVREGMGERKRKGKYKRALLVIAGQLPINLKMQFAVAKYRIKKGLSGRVRTGCLSCQSERYEAVTKRVEDVVISAWQRR